MEEFQPWILSRLITELVPTRDSHPGFISGIHIRDSYQGIALAIPKVLQNQTPLQGLRWRHR
jgi:hypothetical protein